MTLEEHLESEHLLRTSLDILLNQWQAVPEVVAVLEILFSAISRGLQNVGIEVAVVDDGGELIILIELELLLIVERLVINNFFICDLRFEALLVRLFIGLLIV